MKNHVILSIALLFSISFFAQEVNKSYQFIAPVYNEDGDIQFKKGHNVYVSKISKKGKVSFVYYEFTKRKNENIEKKRNQLNGIYVFNSAEINLNGNDANEDLRNLKIHILDTTDFNNYTTELYPRFKGVAAGIFTVPFKLRVKDFDFEQNVNIGMNLSFPFRLNRLKENKDLITPTLGIGLATINLNPKNSNLEESDDNNANRTASAFSISGGLMYQFNSAINVGIQYGFDFLGNNDKDVRWKYDRKPWVGVGINIGTSISDNKKSNPDN